MKKTVIGIVFLFFLGCKKEEVVQKLDLSGTYEGTISGWSQPLPVSGTAIWKITHQDNKIVADIAHSELSGAWLKTAKYEGTVMNDSTIVGGFIQNSFPNPSVVNGKISNDGKSLVFETSGSDASYNYVRVKYVLSKKEN